MKKNLLAIFLIVTLNTLYAQTYFQMENKKFTSNKLTVLSVSTDRISIQVYYSSSERCACEENEIFEIAKNDQDEFKYEIFENPENTIKINYAEDKVTSIEVINNEDFQCCSIISGKYFLKP
jgi:hypothetical protein